MKKLLTKSIPAMIEYRRLKREKTTKAEEKRKRKADSKTIQELRRQYQQREAGE